jgi:APA family basic amino acid/polyamine antiporter
VPASFSPTPETWGGIFSSSFAIGLVYVSFAYSGWNATAYVSSEVHSPQRNIPLSIILGTVLVMLLYVLLNVVFLKSVPVDQLTVDTATMTEKEIGFLSAQALFGVHIGKFLCLIICVFLVSSISSMVIAGPRVIQSIARDYPILKVLGKQSSESVPRLSMTIQALISTIIALSGEFNTVITYTTFAMTLFSTLTVLGMMVLRRTNPQLTRPYRTWGYPITPLMYILANCWFMYFLLTARFMESAIGIAIISLGFLIYWVMPKNASL